MIKPSELLKGKQFLVATLPNDIKVVLDPCKKKLILDKHTAIGQQSIEMFTQYLDFCDTRPLLQQMEDAATVKTEAYGNFDPETLALRGSHDDSRHLYPEVLVIRSDDDYILGYPFSVYSDGQTAIGLRFINF